MSFLQKPPERQLSGPSSLTRPKSKDSPRGGAGPGNRESFLNLSSQLKNAQGTGIEKREIGAMMVKSIFVEVEDSTLQAWLRHFDKNHDMRISFSEFCEGMSQLNYKGDVSELFRAIDTDNSGELSLEEIDGSSATLWIRFRRWCTNTFKSCRDMLLQLSNGAGTVDRNGFIEGVRRMGWTEQLEDMLFNSIDTQDGGVITLAHLKWFELDKQRQLRKQQAKKKSEKENQKRCRDMQIQQHTLNGFKIFLKERYTSLLRAWRCALDLDGSMSLPKLELFKACIEIKWNGDVRALWKALDKDDSGITSLEELDLKSAMRLASFKEFIDAKFGNSQKAFRALDRFNMKKLNSSEFMGACKGHGFTQVSKSLFHGLDYDGKKSITEDELRFLDAWKPPPFLTASPNPKAADDLKAALINKYGNSVKAWRQLLDKDGSNRVSWQEFVDSCKKLRFNGDVPGAWRAMDDDGSGFITLKEIDAHASQSLLGFKKWADEEFGSVRGAFQVFDEDRSNEVDFKEFRKACRCYGFEGDCKTLFQSLDSNNQGLLDRTEITFLDDWEVDFDSLPEIRASLAELCYPKADVLANIAAHLVQYSTLGPGPGAYEVSGNLGQPPSKPCVRHNGSFSFRKRQPCAILENPVQTRSAPSSADYNLMGGVNSVSPRTRTLVFTTTPRPCCTKLRELSDMPGPGHYGLPDYKPASGPTWTLTPRRAVSSHPQARLPKFLKPLPALPMHRSLDSVVP